MVLAFWRWLKQNNLPEADFGIIQFDAGDKIIHNLRWIRSLEEEPTSSNHFAWKYQGQIWDADGEVDLNKESYHQVLSMPADLIESFCVEALEHGCWNPLFNREDAAEILEETLGLDMWDVT